MGMKHKIHNLRENFLLLCRQYSQQGEYIRAEIERRNAGATKDADAARALLLQQYDQMGEQLKAVGGAVERFGDPGIPSTLNTPAPAEEKEEITTYAAMKGDECCPGCGDEVPVTKGDCPVCCGVVGTDGTCLRCGVVRRTNG